MACRTRRCCRAAWLSVRSGLAPCSRSATSNPVVVSASDPTLQHPHRRRAGPGWRLVARLVACGAGWLTPGFAQDETATELQRLRETLAQTERALTEAQAQANNLVQTVRALRADAAALQARAEAAENTAAQMARGRDQATAQAAGLRTTLAQAQRELAAAREQTPAAVDQLTQEVLSLRASLAAAQQHAAEATAGRQQAEAELLTTLQSRDEARRAAEDAIGRVTAISAELSLVQEQMQSLAHSATEARAGMDAERSRLLERLRQVETEAGQLGDHSRRQVAVLRADAARADARMAELERELAEARAAGERLEMAMATLHRERDELVQHARAAVAERESARTVSEAETQAAAARQGQLEGLQQQLAVLEGELVRARSERDAARGQLGSREIERREQDVLRNERDELRRQLELARADATLLRSNQLEEFRREAAATAAERERLEHQVARLEAELSQVRTARDLAR